MGSIGEFPAHPTIDITSYPKLDEKQAGHLRHFHNLVSQPDGQWKHFDTEEYYQEFDDSFRYQLATMTYAAGAAHYHRLPALRGPFKVLIRQMIYKMLRREVWGYWFTSSHGSKMFDPSMTRLREPWADPVVKENIMYSGHLLLMTSLYTMLFDDDEFEKEGGLTLKWDPLFTGLGPEVYKYNIASLSDVILKQMEDNGWVGVCCEPNAVFVVCNQFPIVAIRYNDVRNGTDIISGVLEKYEAALKHKGMMFREDGLYTSFLALKQGKAMPPVHGAHTAWANAFLHAWKPEYVESMYNKQTLGFLTTNSNGKTELNPSRVAIAFRRLVKEEGCDPKDPATLEKARDPVRHVVNPRIPFETLNWGTFTMMLSELGKQKELNDLLEYADTRLNPTWENGGLFYPRNDTLADENWHLTHVEPHSGNSGIGYARLNVEDGQKTMWETPWTRETLSNRPWIEGVTFADDIDFLRGIWDAEKQAMIVTVKRWKDEVRSHVLKIRNLPSATWAVYVDSELRQTEEIGKEMGLLVHLDVGYDEMDIVVTRQD